MKSIEKWIDGTTMYRVVIYGLLALIAWSFVLSGVGLLSIPFAAMVISLVCVVGGALLAHALCVRVSKAPGNIESSLISALILFLLLTPTEDARLLLAATLISASAVALKYVVRWKRRHLFNPVALAVFIAGLTGYIGVEWWVGSRYMLPMAVVAGLLIVKKTRRTALVATYILVNSGVVMLLAPDIASSVDAFLFNILSWPTIFFATVMLTEPLSLPALKRDQYIYASIAGVLGAIPYSFGIIYGTPELSLLVANLYTVMVDLPERVRLTFVRKQEVGNHAWEYFFSTERVQRFVPGQYIEWTLPHESVDRRGIRRYFTLSSAPGAKELSFAVRHPEPQSTWKKKLQTLSPGEVLYAAQRAGDFVLRPDARHHVWIAGGIGVTPFVSMVRTAREHGVSVPITLFYCNRTKEDIAFLDLFTEAKAHGVEVVHVLESSSDPSFEFEKGPLTEALVRKYVSDWKGVTCYISGPPGFVSACAKLCRSLSVPRWRIVTDYFPGLA